MQVRSLVWLGIRTEQFTEMVTLYRDVLGMKMVKDEPDAAWFTLADGTEIHIYGPGDEDHTFFGAGPVVGLLVDDFDEARKRMIEAGITFVGEPQQHGPASWNHYLAPDGNVYEIMSGVTLDRATDAPARGEPE